MNLFSHRKYNEAVLYCNFTYNLQYYYAPFLKKFIGSVDSTNYKYFMIFEKAARETFGFSFSTSECLNFLESIYLHEFYYRWH